MHLLSIDDLADVDIDAILDRSRSHLRSIAAVRPTPFSTGLVFLSSSLRTRVGFASATVKLGGVPIEVPERRGGTEMSVPESLGDTLRTASGLVDVLVTRTVHPLGSAVDGIRSPIVNGGEAGGEHPTQALIDLLAIEEEKGDLEELSIGLCGDLAARTTRSLVKLFGRRQPKELVLMGPSERPLAHHSLTMELGKITRFEEQLVPDGLDVLYMIGLAPGAGGGEDRLPDSTRRRFALDLDGLRRLPPNAVVLSPLPLIDEVAREVWSDPRIRIFEQSDRGVAVRMACLEHVLGV
jgi:aspartate carbamoyltransferase catalytic subunit